MENCEYGIYGVLDDMPENLLYPQGLRAGARSAVHTGTASIIATVDADGPQEYGVEIVRCSSGFALDAQYGAARDRPGADKADRRHRAGHERQSADTGWDAYRRGDARLSERRDTGIWHVYRVDARKKRRDGRVGTGRVNTTERRGADENAYSMRDARQQYLDAYAAHVGG